MYYDNAFQKYVNRLSDIFLKKVAIQDKTLFK